MRRKESKLNLMSKNGSLKNIEVSIERTKERWEETDIKSNEKAIIAL
jgi:hypothetical protein